MSHTESFKIKGLGGKRTLEGTISVNGAKNAVLQAFAFPFLFKSGVTLENVPHIEDTDRMTEILEGMGMGVQKTSAKSFEFKAKGTLSPELPYELARRLRASIVLIGPVLSRLHEVRFPHPGGCVIGNRPIDIFLDAFAKLGATLSEEGDYYVLRAPQGLIGAPVYLRVPSVTATQTLMMGAVLAKGTTTIKNAALEPETIALADFLNSCGAKIKGAGTPTITIEGGDLLDSGGKAFNVPPDRLEAGSFLILGALAAKDLTITGCIPEHIDPVIEALRSAGVPLEVGDSWVRVKSPAEGTLYRGVEIKTHEYPGFPTDLQAPMVVFLTQTEGESLVFETIFEGRLGYTEGLNKMGASIKMWDSHRATVHGPTPLKGKELEGPDIRAGLAYVIAGIIATGESTIRNAYYVDRGYEDIEGRLGKLGVSIERVTE